MSTTVQIENLSTGTIGSVFFSTLIAGQSKTITDAPTVDIDSYLDDYDRASALGAYITVDGSLRAGALFNDSGETADDDIRVIKSDTNAGAHTLVLMPIANVPSGTTLFINFAVDGGDLTLDGSGGELIDGNATLVLTAVGITRLQSNGVSWDIV